MQEMVCDKLAIDRFFGSALFQEPQRLCEMVVQNYRFVSQLSDLEIFLSNILFKGSASLNLLECILQLNLACFKLRFRQANLGFEIGSLLLGSLD